MADFYNRQLGFVDTVTGMNYMVFRLCASVTMVCLLGVASSLGGEGTAPSGTARPDPWQPVRVLLGRWEGEVSGEPGKGKSEREYKFTLNNHYIQIANKSVYPPQTKNPKGETHEDIGVISYEKSTKKLILRQFHIEGFVNQYSLEKISEDGRTFTFITTAIENIPPGWRAREAYRIVSENEFVETFSLAEPEKDFVTYSETRFRRKK